MLFAHLVTLLLAFRNVIHKIESKLIVGLLKSRLLNKNSKLFWEHKELFSREIPVQFFVPRRFEFHRVY